MPRSRSTGSRPTRRRAAKPAPPSAVRIHEAVGSSRSSWAAAVADAVRGAKKEAPEPIAVEVVRLWGDLGGTSAVSLYRASVKIAYREELRRPR
ncbi:MAG: dodecin domain-containing protein [Chloroflexi bacterium]|nr:dodecin domain-containing protein [Chloroflexota bacterium]